jgi:ribonuclease BN (tRNA processing enzyme)
LHIVVASGKAFAQDREEARRCGADEFIPKPYETAKLKDSLMRLLKRGPQFKPQPAKAPAFHIRIWGSRASAPSIGGPPTSCVAVEFGDRRLILDAGSGLQTLAGENPKPVKDLWLLLTHHHADHISGLAHAAKLAVPGLPIKIAGPSDTRMPLSQVVAAAFQANPITPPPQLFVVTESRFPVWPDVFVSAIYVRHPGSTLAYRIEHQDRRLVYCPDNEIEPEGKTRTDSYEKLARFVQGADLLIHDTRYRDEDYPQHLGEGHSCPRLALNLAVKEGVRRLLLFHLDPAYSDVRLQELAMSCREKMRKEFASLEVGIALPGVSLGV